MQIFIRRAQAYRRAYTASESNEAMIKDILELYEKEGNPAILKDGGLEHDGMKRKVIAGEPATKLKAEVRKQCKPKGPVGHLLETVHMQAAVMDKESTVWQNDKIPVQLIEAPYQQVAGMVATMAMRKRTMAAANPERSAKVYTR